METPNNNSGATPAFDLEKNCASLKISKEIYLRILGKAVQQTSQDLRDLNTALKADDKETIQRISHRLKGDYDNLRLSDMAQIARGMNEMIKADQYDKLSMSRSYQQFLTLFMQLQQFMKTPGPPAT